MSLKQRLRRLQQKAEDGAVVVHQRDGSLRRFDPQEVAKDRFLYLAHSMTADYKRVPRPEPPEVLRAVASAKDRGEALSIVMGDYGHLPVDREALIARGEFVHRSLVEGKSYEDLGISEDPGE